MAEQKKTLTSIKFSGKAFKKDEERSSLRGSERFTKDVQLWNKLVESLDRHDSFAKLLIAPRLYQEREFEAENGTVVTYGIPPQSFHETEDDVIFQHQKESAEEFLKKLRGFGLLADVVGSGKTFEAGIVLSELAVRGLVSSMLLIVPGQVYGAWVRTIERFFGLGKWDGEKTPKDDKIPVVLKPVGPKLDPADFERGEDGFDHPKYQMIVKMEDFVLWDDSAIKNKLFDVVVVDEAHHLNIDKGQDAKAMVLLSEIMKTKKAANMTYCLLLSATPHAGNLVDMFRLWYFIRCKGGDPNDFREGVKRSHVYEEEKDFYFRNICRGATTIMDFVRKEKISMVRGGDAVYCKGFRNYLIDNHPEVDFESLDAKGKDDMLNAYFESTGDVEGRRAEDITNAKNYILKYYNETFSPALAKVRKAFSDFLKEKGYDDYDFYYEGLKEQRIDEFLDEDYETKEKVKKMIAESYHHGVLRSIMIRQPQARVAKPASRKKVVNLMFFRTDKAPSATVNVKGLSDDDGVRITMGQGGIDLLNENEIFTPLFKGQPVKNVLGKELTYNLPGYIDAACKKDGAFSYGNAYAKFVRDYLTEFGLSDSDSICDENNPAFATHFHRRRSISFYESLVKSMRAPTARERSDGSSEVRYSFEPLYDKSKSDFDFKMNKLHEILRQHKDNRVIVFFDYEVADEDKLAMPVYEVLKASPEFGKRVIDVSMITEDTRLEKIFNDNPDCILVVTDPALTEGANLQTCSIIVNFQVTPNPLDMQQRIGRVFRLGQEQDVIIYSIANMFELEGYVLSYFTRIGLMSGNTGDAEILAGCNNDNMVTIRCPRTGCGNVELVSKEDFESRGVILCSRCQEAHMEEITTRNIKCDNPACAKVMTRSTKSEESMYSCVAGDSGIMCNSGEFGGRTYYCHKICAIAHCQRFVDGDMAGQCRALEIYRRLKTPTSAHIKAACAVCPHKEACRKRGCIIGEGPDAIKACSTCRYADCNPKPHQISFDTNWEATCPACKKGTMRPLKSSTFEAFIRALYGYKFDGGASFCDSFQKEINKVLDIQDILRSDNLKIDD